MIAAEKIPLYLFIFGTLFFPVFQIHGSMADLDVLDGTPKKQVKEILNDSCFMSSEAGITPSSAERIRPPHVQISEPDSSEITLSLTPKKESYLGISFKTDAQEEDIMSNDDAQYEDLAKIHFTAKDLAYLNHIKLQDLRFQMLAPADEKNPKYQSPKVADIFNLRDNVELYATENVRRVIAEEAKTLGVDSSCVTLSKVTSGLAGGINKKNESVESIEQRKSNRDEIVCHLCNIQLICSILEHGSVYLQIPSGHIDPYNKNTILDFTKEFKKLIDKNQTKSRDFNISKYKEAFPARLKELEDVFLKKIQDELENSVIPYLQKAQICIIADIAKLKEIRNPQKNRRFEDEEIGPKQCATMVFLLDQKSTFKKELAYDFIDHLALQNLSPLAATDRSGKPKYFTVPCNIMSGHFYVPHHQVNVSSRSNRFKRFKTKLHTHDNQQKQKLNAHNKKQKKEEIKKFKLICSKDAIKKFYNKLKFSFIDFYMNQVLAKINNNKAQLLNETIPEIQEIYK